MPLTVGKTAKDALLSRRRLSIGVEQLQMDSDAKSQACRSLKHEDRQLRTATAPWSVPSRKSRACAELVPSHVDLQTFGVGDKVHRRGKGNHLVRDDPLWKGLREAESAPLCPVCVVSEEGQVPYLGGQAVSCSA